MMHMKQGYRRLLLSTTVAIALCSFSLDASAQGRPLQTYPAASPGCDQSAVEPAMSNAGAYTYAEEYSTTYSLIHQPTSFYGCLQNLFNEANSLLNMFNGLGNISISGILETLAEDAIKELLNQLENQVCNAVQGAATGPAANLLSYMNNTNGANY